MNEGRIQGTAACPKLALGEAATDSQRSLGAVARLGRKTQQVREGAVAVDLSALNAMLVAHRASASARGFRTAAAQMRVFSTDLGARMEAMAALVAELSADVAQQSKRLRAGMKLSAAQGEGADAALAVLRSAQVRRTERGRARLLNCRQRLGRCVTQAQRLCGSGRNLARCALIEASQAESMATALAQVAQELGTAIETITEVLETMQHDLQEFAA